MPYNPKSLANLTAMGRLTSENAPKGRTNAGLSVNEERNRMATWPRARLEAVSADPDSNAAQITAANQWLRAMDDDGALKDICEFTHSKPAQVTVNHEVAHVRAILTRDAPTRN